MAMSFSLWLLVLIGVILLLVLAAALIMRR